MRGIFRADQPCGRCLNCLRSCPTQAIALAKKQVLSDRCIHCGICLTACPEQCYQTEGLDRLKKVLASPLRKIALVSPLVAAAVIESDPEQMAAALCRLGFDEVYLADAGLKMVAEEYRKTLARTNSTLIASHCPAVTELIEKFYPELVGALMPALSPELACVRYLTRSSGPAGMVLVSACPGRGFEQKAYSGAATVISFTDLRRAWSKSGIEPAQLPRRKFSSLHLPGESALLGQGDLLEAARGGGAEPAGLVASGYDQVKQILDSIRLGEVRARLLELNFCAGGCVGSPAVTSRLGLGQRKDRAANYLSSRSAAERVNLRVLPSLEIDLRAGFSAKRTQRPEPGADKVKAALSNLGFNSELEVTNCSVCGYPSCAEFAQALLRGDAESNYCFPALIRKMERVDERILRSERLASVGQIASALAHEVNNPLGLASGYAQAIAGDERLPADLREIIGLIREEIENAASTIQNLLSLSRDRPLKFERVNLYEVLAATLRLVAPRLETSGISLKFNYVPSPVLLECDPYGLQQVFTNLVLNAWQAMPEGGTMNVSVEAGPEQVELAFRDTGGGIKPEHLPRLFDPFFTTKPPGEGTGLGLTIAYNIIERHQGDIRVWSQLGKGTEFKITLPLSQGMSRSRTVPR